MHLDRVEINNFRSIEELTITFKPKCRVLVGINESGKSNILEALSMLSDDRQPSKLDRRVGQPNEPRDMEFNIHYVFSLENEESAQIAEEIKKKILSKKKNVTLISQGRESYTIEKFCSSREALYWVDIVKEKSLQSIGG